MGKLVGYARVSTSEQNNAVQVAALEQAGCKGNIFTEVASGKNTQRPELALLLEYLKPGDTLVVWKLDRLGRSLADILRIIEGLTARGVSFKSITDGISLGDDSNPTGKAMLQMIGIFAELERSLMLERTHAGLAAARAKGKIGGRRSVLTKPQAEEIKALLASNIPVTTIAKRHGVSRVTIYKIQNGTYVFTD